MTTKKIKKPKPNAGAEAMQHNLKVDPTLRREFDKIVYGTRYKTKQQAQDAAQAIARKIGFK